MHDLIARLENTPGLSRELDHRIGKAIGMRVGRFVWWTDPETGERRFVCAEGEHVPELTASLDAACTLLQDDWAWSVGFSQGCYAATVFDGAREHDGLTSRGTAALALAAAALKARMTRGETT